MTEIETFELSKSDPAKGRSAARMLGLAWLGLTAIASGLLAQRWAMDFQGKELWLAGMVLALGLAPALQMLAPRKKLRWLGNLSLEALAATLFVSGVCQGGAFWMWTIGSLVAIVPLALWALEPEVEPDLDLESLAQRSAFDEAPAVELAAAA